MSIDCGFTVIPAIDLKEGRCVRLWQGDLGKETVYSDRPEEVAVRWQSTGARMIHVVDLDGAVSGRMINRAVVERIVAAVSVPVELGGGIRERATMDAYHALGVRRLILGTTACREPQNLGRLLDGFPGEVYVGLDARKGLVAVNGWTETLALTAAEMARVAKEAGAAGIIFTDISRDGTLEGPNVEAVIEFLGTTDLPVIASGGVASLEDVVRLASLASVGLTGVILGRALYTGRVDLKKALSYDVAPAGGR